MTNEQIAELRRLHDNVIAQDFSRELADERVMTISVVYRENVAFMLACNSMIRQILDEREALLEAARHVVEAASAGIGPMTASELRLRDAVAKAEAP